MLTTEWVKDVKANMNNIVFIGLGNMGRPIAENVLAETTAIF
jgi:hypothetical protein